MKKIEQLRKWVKGESLHNDELDECCPDFSCCNSDMDTPLEVRVAFMAAYLKGDKEQVNRLLGMFLGQAMMTIPHQIKKFLGE